MNMYVFGDFGIKTYWQIVNLANKLLLVSYKLPAASQFAVTLVRIDFSGYRRSSPD